MSVRRELAAFDCDDVSAVVYRDTSKELIRFVR
jgi:hypothetical protein